MPELPEVEVTRISFSTRIAGARVIAVRQGKPLRWPLGCEPTALVGQMVGDVSRRGKYLWLSLDGGGLLLHLGMSGSLLFSDTVSPPGVHDHFDLVTTHGTLRLTDPRRFGSIVWSCSLSHDPAAKRLAGLGIEPFDPAFNGEYLQRAFQRRRMAVKPALLAGDVVVGAGNIYACEALFTAGIDPRARCGTLNRPRCGRLADALRDTLAHAVALGGSSLRDFRNAHGVAGEFQNAVFVYGRDGQACQFCTTAIRRIVQGQRASFCCPRCQKR